MKQTLQLQLIVTDPLPGAQYAMQRGKSELLPPTPAADGFAFDFTVLADLSVDPPRLTGEFTQGPPAQRFVYVNTGTYAGQTETSWARRAKVPITGIPVSLMEQALASNGALQARVKGVAKDGGPFCASVQLSSDWSLTAPHRSTTLTSPKLAGGKVTAPG